MDTVPFLLFFILGYTAFGFSRKAGISQNGIGQAFMYGGNIFNPDQVGKGFPPPFAPLSALCAHCRRIGNIICIFRYCLAPPPLPPPVLPFAGSGTAGSIPGFAGRGFLPPPPITRIFSPCAYCRFLGNSFCIRQYCLASQSMPPMLGPDTSFAKHKRQTVY